MAASRAMTHRELEQLAESFEPGIRSAYLEAITGIRDEATARMLEFLVRAGQVDLAMEALGINAARFAPLAETVRTAYLQSGLRTAMEVPPLRHTGLGGSYQVAFRFDLTNPRAEQWVREHSSKLVTAIVEDQRHLIRATVAEGLAVGRNPRQTALDIVGRVGVTGRRSGGVLGLTSQQAQFVASAREELSSPAGMARYFSRQRRDKRFDATVRKAMREGRALSPEQIDRITGRYADRLLQLRGEMIARTESITSMNAAREESYRQAIEAGDLLPENVIGIWGATGDRRTRDSHFAMNGQQRRFGQPFVTPGGASMRYPGDIELGAGAEETVQCRCTKTYRIKYAANRLAAN